MGTAAKEEEPLHLLHHRHMQQGTALLAAMSQMCLASITLLFGVARA
jgi:hypothetical protein